MVERILSCLKNGLNQEAYSILTTFDFLKINFTQVQLCQLFGTIKYQRFDDFSISILLRPLVFKISNDKFSETNQEKVFSALHEGLQVDGFPNKYFINEHWLLRYTLFYLYKNNKKYRTCIKKFYSTNRKGSSVLDYDKFRNGGLSCPVDKFYLKLLEKYNISLININMIYKSTDL